MPGKSEKGQYIVHWPRLYPVMLSHNNIASALESIFVMTESKIAFPTNFQALGCCYQ